MLYFANPSTPPVCEAMTAGELGAILTPKQYLDAPEAAAVIVDNGCGPGANGAPGKGWPGVRQFDAWLRSMAADPELMSRIRFATAPDVVGNAEATLRRSWAWMGRMRRMGYKVAFVAQDGIEKITIPWDRFDVLFIGGSTEFKIGPIAHRFTREAIARGKSVHMGRVNSKRRWDLAESWGCESTDGTFIRFAPTLNLNRARAWWSTPRIKGDQSMTTDADPFSNPTPANPEDLGNAPVDFTQPGGATSTAGTEWEETGGRRKMPHPETGVPTWFTRASKMGGWIAEQFTLTEWKIANAVAGVAHNRDLYGKANSLEVPEIEEREKGWWTPWAEIGHEAMDRIGASSGAHEGTAVHRYREQVDAGTRALEDVPAEWRSHIEASLRRRVALSMEIVHAEAFICNTQVHNGASGRLDNLLRGPDGRLVIEDLKTGKNVPMGLDEIAIQLAIYANADWFYDVQAKTWLPMPNVRKDVAIVTWVPIDRPDEAETIIVDIAWGWAAAQVAGWVQGYRNRGKRKGDGLRLPLAALSEPERAPDWRTLLPGAQITGEVHTGSDERLEVERDLEDQERARFHGHLASCMIVTTPRDEIRSDHRCTCGKVIAAAEANHQKAALVRGKTDPTCAANGSPLQPLADREAGERGCSVCGRKGHRKSSAKCLGDQDPATGDYGVASDPKLDAANETYQDRRPDAPVSADEEHWIEDSERIAEEQDVIDGKPTGLGIVSEVLKHISRGELPTFCTCTSGRPGWTRVVDPETGEDSWVCGTCKLPSRAALMHEAAGTMPVGQGRPAEHSAFTAAEAQALLDQVKSAPVMIAGPEVEIVTPEQVARKRIEAASTLDDLSALYLELYPAGQWTDQLQELATRRQAEIKGEAPRLRSV